ncbi:hypothetical protein [Streptomyces violarus]|uniref:hypothetical protein n=1 Tax=Streptomyces violarus TaxID=67380 RepID=UPI0021BE2D7F|nr:hypothetical protein [Streptomyces violarus]MCT9144673.1 hypothetical protein [Streptomyces violarus]
MLTAVIAAGVTGCTHDGDRGGAGGAATAPRAAPLRDLTYVEETRLSDAEQRIVQLCMEHHGFRYGQRERLTMEEERPVGYVQDDVAWAREHGYGSRIREKADRARREDPNYRYRAQLSATRGTAYDIALDGGRDAKQLSVDVPGGGTIRKRVGGCLAEAQTKLYGEMRTWFRADAVAGNLRPLYVSDLLKDKQFTAAVEAWARCMRQSGHAYTDPAEARDGVGKWAMSRPRAEAFRFETRVAVADAQCARETSLKATGTAREAHYVDRLRDRYGADLDTYQRLRMRALGRAEKIVGPRA